MKNRSNPLKLNFSGFKNLTGLTFFWLSVCVSLLLSPGCLLSSVPDNRSSSVAGEDTSNTFIPPSSFPFIQGENTTLPSEVNITFLHRFFNWSNIPNMWFDGEYLYLVSPSEGMIFILNISNPLYPILSSQIVSNDILYDIVVQD